MEFLHSFLRRHLAGKPVVASPNVGCFLKLVFLTGYPFFFSDQAMKNRLFAHTMKLDMFTKPNYLRPNEE